MIDQILQAKKYEEALKTIFEDKSKLLTKHKTLLAKKKDKVSDITATLNQLKKANSKSGNNDELDQRIINNTNILKSKRFIKKKAKLHYPLQYYCILCMVIIYFL